jgi:small-conductance mechanosensitive channel
MFLLERVIKDRMRRSIAKDIFAIIFLSIIWAIIKKIFEILGDTGNAIKIGSINLNLSLYTIAHYIVYICIIALITKRTIAAVDKYIFILFRGQVRKKFLITKVTNVLIYFISALILLDVLSVDTKIIATLGGAIGIGLGFGLQKITSNFISGVILFAEQSVSIEDVIELKDGTIGFIKQMSARYILLETSDGKEVFIPNEEFVINKVINWTHSNNICRDDFNITISHDSDIELAMNLIKEQIKLCPDLVQDQKSDCLIYGYDHFGVILVLKVWLLDIKQHSNTTKSNLLLQILNSFRVNNIKMPSQKFNINIEK